MVAVPKNFLVALLIAFLVGSVFVTAAPDPQDAATVGGRATSDPHPGAPDDGLAIHPDDVTLCADLPVVAHDDADPAFDLTCPAAIRPGAASNSCTLNFVVTDGEKLYIGGAGHCAGLGKRLRVAGVPGEVGTAVHRACCGLAGDWVFFEIDPEDEASVDPTMCRYGGPVAGALGASRMPIPGELALHYGHGRGHGQTTETKGRVGAAVVPLPVLGPVFGYVGSVGVGDSGSPVRAASGEAIGIAVAALAPQGTIGYEYYGLVVASNFQDALDSLAADLGRDVWVVEGDPLPDWARHITDDPVA